MANGLPDIFDEVACAASIMYLGLNMVYLPLASKNDVYDLNTALLATSIQGLCI